MHSSSVSFSSPTRKHWSRSPETPVVERDDASVSLLDRLCPPSLLSRLSPPKTLQKPSLAARISSHAHDPEYEEATHTPEEGETNGAALLQRATYAPDNGQMIEQDSESGRQSLRSLSSRSHSSPSTQGSLESHIGLGNVATVDRPVVRTGTEVSERGSELPSSSAASEAAVNDLLASILDVEHDDEGAPAPAAPPPAHTSGPPEVSQSVLIEECRRLLLPQLIENVWRRGPGPYADADAIARRAREFLTEERCKEFVDLAHAMRDQLNERSLREGGNAAHGGDGEQVDKKRRRDEGALEGDGGTRAKRPRSCSDHASTPNLHIQEEEQVEATLSGPAAVVEESPVLMTSNSEPLRPQLPTAADVGLSPSEPMSFSSTTLNSVDPVSPTAFPTGDIPADDLAAPGLSLGDNFRDPPSNPSSPVPMPGSSNDAPVPPPMYSNFVPGLWDVTIGKERPAVFEYDFYVDDAAAAGAQRWARRDDCFGITETHVSVHLLCLPTEAVAEANAKLLPTATPENVAQTLWEIPVVWPRMGKLVVQMNTDEMGSDQTWFPVDLAPTSGPLDITPYVRAGRNQMRLLQLCDLSSCAFVVHASFPSEHERQRYATLNAQQLLWTRFVERESARSCCTDVDKSVQVSGTSITAQ